MCQAFGVYLSPELIFYPPGYFVILLLEEHGFVSVPSLSVFGVFCPNIFMDTTYFLKEPTRKECVVLPRPSEISYSHFFPFMELTQASPKAVGSNTSITW